MDEEELIQRRKEEERAVREAGGGEAEGFEEAERLLEENATHGEGGADPLVDRFTPEQESDRSTAEYGEPDELESTEVDHDGDGRPDPP
jgi:hypothetical protein